MFFASSPNLVANANTCSVAPHLLRTLSCSTALSKVKIDYQPRAIKVGALQHGDYLELLNLFPLEGVHLTLQKLLLTGVSGWNGVTQLLLQVHFPILYGCSV